MSRLALCSLSISLLLAAPAARAALDRLMDLEGVTLYVQPDRLWLRVRPRHALGKEVETWLRALVDLALTQP